MPTDNPSGHKADNLIWIDLEMTGLDTQRDSIIEIATIVTDKDLHEVAEGPVFAIGQPRLVMENMDEWNTRQHGDSGLTTRVLASNITAREAELATLEFLSKWVDPGMSPMCGNSVCQDRRFLAREMPELEAFFHYRSLDVSTLKILAQLWAPNIVSAFEKSSTHRALDDIRDSIDELIWYRARLLNKTVMDSGTSD